MAEEEKREEETGDRSVGENNVGTSIHVSRKRGRPVKSTVGQCTCTILGLKQIFIYWYEDILLIFHLNIYITN